MCLFLLSFLLISVFIVLKFYECKKLGEKVITVAIRKEKRDKVSNDFFPVETRMMNSRIQKKYIKINETIREGNKKKYSNPNKYMLFFIYFYLNQKRFRVN